MDTENHPKEELNDSEYKIYEVNSLSNPKKEINNLTMEYFTNNNDYKTRNINEFLNANLWLDNENGKDQKINLVDYINKAKEKLNKIRNNNLDEKNIMNKKKIKSTLNYILNKNLLENNLMNNNTELDNNNNEKERPINLKGNIKINKSNKYVIKTSKRMQNFLNSNINNNSNKISAKKIQNSKMSDNVPNIRSIADEKIEVFDEEEFLQIKKRNLTSKKNNIKINLEEDFKKLNRKNIRYRKNNDSINYDNIGNKTTNGENILPPNNLNIKPILNQNIVKTILKSKFNF